jgi:DNA topoisomerase VI subunit A
MINDPKRFAKDMDRYSLTDFIVLKYGSLVLKNINNPNVPKIKFLSVWFQISEKNFNTNK